MKRETTEEALLALREQLHEMSNALNQMALKVNILWEERKQRRVQAGPELEDRR